MAQRRLCAVAPDQQQDQDFTKTFRGEQSPWFYLSSRPGSGADVPRPHTQAWERL